MILETPFKSNFSVNFCSLLLAEKKSLENVVGEKKIDFIQKLTQVCLWGRTVDAYLRVIKWVDSNIHNAYLYVRLIVHIIFCGFLGVLLKPGENESILGTRNAISPVLYAVAL